MANDRESTEVTNSSDQFNIGRSSMRNVARPASAFGFCTTTSVMRSVVPSGTVYVASPSWLSVTLGASVWENRSPATAAVVGPGELVTVGATVVGAVLVVAGKVVALATVVVTTSVRRWSTASSAASSIAGLTKPNQPRARSASTATAPITQLHNRSGSIGVCTSVPLAVTVGAPVCSASIRNGSVRRRRSHCRCVVRTRARTSTVPPGSTPTDGGWNSASRRLVVSTNRMRQLACTLPRFSNVSS